MDTTSTFTMPEFFGKTCDWYDVPCHASSVTKWAGAFLQYLPMKAFEQLCAGLGSVISGVPAPSFFLTAGTALSQIPSSVAFFAQAFQIGPGITMILSAYVLRWSIRRMPFIG